jgi:hypothetical protein
MRGLAGFAIGAACIFAVVWLGIIHPSLKDSPSESYNWTTNCFAQEGFQRVKSAEDQLAVNGLRVIAVTRGADQAIVFIADSRDLAKKALQASMTAAQSNGIPHDEATKRIQLLANEILAYAGHLPPAKARAAFANCVYEIRDNRWTAFTGFDTKSVGRPFRTT